MTLIVNGTWESEFRTRFCPKRFIYSDTTGSVIIFDCVSTCWETCFPNAICFSRLYQLPIPFEQPTLRLPIASRSSIPPSCATFVADGSTGAFTVGAFWELDWSLLFSLAAKDVGAR